MWKRRRPALLLQLRRDVSSTSAAFTHRYQHPDDRTYHYRELCEIRARDQQYGLSTPIATTTPVSWWNRPSR